MDVAVQVGKFIGRILKYTPQHPNSQVIANPPSAIASSSGVKAFTWFMPDTEQGREIHSSALEMRFPRSRLLAVLGWVSIA